MPGEVGCGAIDISPAQDGGVLKEIIKPGAGDLTPSNGSTVNVHYTGTLVDGTKFDSSRDRGPFSFSLGQGSVIKAWDIGVATMKKGEICKLTCLPEYAYGSRETGSIPANSTLIFEIEMLDWELEDLSSKQDKGILRQILTPGVEISTPSSGSTVDVHVTGEYNGTVFDDRDVSFPLGEGSEFNIPKGLEKALQKFKVKEKSRLEIKARYGFGSEGNKQLNVPPNVDLVYVVTLNSFTELKKSWSMDDAEKIKHAKMFKEKGLKYINAQKYNLALNMYKNMITYIDSGYGFSEELEKERKSLLIAARLNCALCLLKQEKYTEAQAACKEVLDVDPNNIKALYRRGQAYLGLSDADAAKESFEAVLKVDSSNKAAASALAQCNKKIKEQKEKEKQVYWNMFAKFAKKDQEEKDWRFGWWDGKNVNVEKYESDPEDDEEQKKEKRKQREIIAKKAAEVRARREKERQEQLEREKTESEKEKTGMNENNDCKNTQGNITVDDDKITDNGNAERTLTE
ncbi:unnamed protein product [Bemisia tabaci]|uniref:peptidylprolyl isomerase n=2 Tax=Bemisia tabaci TaxID=7038 RepID=A0A9P0C9I0_BEMTA|nr:unnamed protein product [Bemisia tabaci]